MRISIAIMIAVLGAVTILPSHTNGQTHDSTTAPSDLADTSPLRRRGITRFMPARILVRALFGSAPGDAPLKPISPAETPLPEDFDLPPIELQEELVIDETMDVEFRYDETLDEPPVSDQFAADESLEELEDHATNPPEMPETEPQATERELAPLESGPLSTLPPSPDPFFGGVHRLLSAGDHQPLFPRHTVRPPGTPFGTNGQWLLVDATGSPVAVDDLPHVANGDLLIVTTRRCEVDSPGKVVLLVDGRALLLEVTDWQTGTVHAQMPAIRLSKPTPARLYLSNAGGLVIDGIDFVLLPPTEE